MEIVVLVTVVFVVVLVTAASPFVFGPIASKRLAPHQEKGRLSLTRCLQHTCTGIVLFSIDRFHILTKAQSAAGLSFGLAFVREWRGLLDPARSNSS